jgi:hypothetical protein
MKRTTVFTGILAAAALCGGIVAPLSATAQSSASHHRQQTKNTWRNAAIGSGAVGLYGLLSHNSTLGILGGAGTLYSLNRYEHDRKSQSKIDHDRAAFYGRSSYSRNGHTYHRRIITKNGHKYYQFVRR